MFTSEIFRYRSQSVRDLVSILLGPPLVDAWVGKHFEPTLFEVLGASWGKSLYEKNKARIEALDRDSAEFEVWLQTHQKTKRLGYYFEQLVEWVLQNLSAAENIIENIERSVQIQGADSQTQGELDFWFLQNSKPVHLEVAIKFYLESSEGFVGPDVARSQDRLDSKWDRLRNLQTQILETIQGKSWLRHKGVSESSAVVKQILLKGHLFSRSEWGRVDELHRLCVDSTTSLRYEHLDRSRWLSPAVQNIESPRLWTCDELKSQAQEKLLLGVRPWLIAESAQKTHAGVTAFFEKRRFFVVPNGWTTG